MGDPWWYGCCCCGCPVLGCSLVCLMVDVEQVVEVAIG